MPKALCWPAAMPISSAALWMLSQSPPGATVAGGLSLAPPLPPPPQAASTAGASRQASQRVNRCIVFLVFAMLAKLIKGNYKSPGEQGDKRAGRIDEGAAGKSGGKAGR
ncbi:hypothetical protein IV454_00270 [Massilia antarctica]|uniref:Secreted protein n=1 Tax=Massilia antarctica TaxID=2765360 RepID=A0AA49A8H0_9BURK|nr:hypothetical protein [Massilia antarctica]QPI50116.1 hypothetical protein IV454_00270 [Massilia antarctica]